MDCWNINLLSDEQLAALGLCEAEIGIIGSMRPIGSMLDLLLADGFDAALVRNLLDQGILAGARDRALLLDDDVVAATPRFVSFFDNDDDDESEGEAPGGIPFIKFLTKDGNQYYEIEPAGKTPANLLPDCAAKVELEVKGHGFVERKLAQGENFTAVEKEAKALAKAALATALGDILNQSRCLDKDGRGCTSLIPRLITQKLIEIFSVPSKRRMSVKGPQRWKSRYVAYAKIELSCA